MAGIKTKQVIKRRKVTFSLENAEAKEVFLTGDFNNWHPEKHPMQKDKKGTWKKQVMLSPGNYEYKFLVDGQWKEDPKNDRLHPNCFGTYNNIINVFEKK
jgi:5'-AMP-activated protein kinase regulatory beta subunit